MLENRLEKARAKTSVNREVLTNIIYGGPSAANRRREITSLFENDPAFDKRHRVYQNHTQRYEQSIAKCAAFHLKCEELGLTDPTDLRWAYEGPSHVLEPFVLPSSRCTPNHLLA